VLILKIVRGAFFEHFASVDSKWVSAGRLVSNCHSSRCLAASKKEKREQGSRTPNVVVYRATYTRKYGKVKKNLALRRKVIRRMGTGGKFLVSETTIIAKNSRQVSENLSSVPRFPQCAHRAGFSPLPDSGQRCQRRN